MTYPHVSLKSNSTSLTEKKKKKKKASQGSLSYGFVLSWVFPQEFLSFPQTKEPFHLELWILRDRKKSPMKCQRRMSKISSLMKINCLNEEKKCWATGGHFQGLLCYFWIAVRLFLIPGVKAGGKKSSVFLNDLELLAMWLLKCLAQTYKNVMDIYQPGPKIYLPALYHQSSC